MSYNAVMEVPVKYLGAEVTDLIAKINDDQLKDLTIPVTTSIGGDYANPVIQTDLKSGVKDLTVKLVDIQKQKLIGQGKDKATELLTDILNPKGDEKDSVSVGASNEKEEGVKDIIGGILNNQSKTSDSVKTKETGADSKSEAREITKGILGGLLGSKKKKDTTVVKDTIK